MAENAEQDAFGQEYRKMLIIDLSNGTIDAAKLTKTAWLHTKSGGRGVEDLMLEPTDANAKHASELVERIFRAEYPPPPLLKLAVPATPKRDNNRDNSYVVDVQLPSSILIELVENHIEAIDAMQAELLDLFRTHPVVTEARSEPNPIHESRLRPATIYWDGVGYSKRDQFLGFFLYCFASRKSFLLFSIRKEDTCKCGCRGYCTLYPLLWTIAADILYKCNEHRDIARFVFCFTKGDWPAFCEVACLRQWSHDHWPCFECQYDKREICDLSHFTECSQDEGPWELYSAEDYTEDVNRCQIRIRVDTREMHSDIKRSLRYKKRFIGRGLINDLPLYGLIKGDRLEATPAILDVALFDECVPPFDCIFWRMAKEDRVLHASPLFLIPGLSTQTHGGDVLHTWALGPVSADVALAIWWLVKSPAFRVSIPGLDEADEIRLSLHRIRDKLWEHYRFKRSDPHWRTKGTEIWNLTEKMIGKQSHPMLNAKAAEARGLLDFCCSILSEVLPSFEVSMQKNVHSSWRACSQHATWIPLFAAQGLQRCHLNADANYLMTI